MCHAERSILEAAERLKIKNVIVHCRGALEETNDIAMTDTNSRKK